MQAENITENELCEKKIIPTKFDEKLSWDYLKYVRENKVIWTTPTEIFK